MVVTLEAAVAADTSAALDVQLVLDPDASEIRTSGVSEIRTSGVSGVSGVSGMSGVSEPRTSGAPDASGSRTAPDKRANDQRGSLYMHMRGPEWHLSDGDADRILDHPLPPPPKVYRSGRLQSAPGGTGVIADAVTAVTVEPDGTAHFHDAKDFTFHFHLPLPSLDDLRHSERALRGFGDEIGRGLREWYADPEAIARGGPATELPEHLEAEPNQCDRWGDKMCEPEPMPPPTTIASGKADLTAYLMRKFHVGDPFSSRKRALLDITREERGEQGAVFRAQQLARSAELMRRNLERLWATQREPAARREALFTLWDECTEGDTTAGQAGDRARAEVLGWIAAHLPETSPDAFTRDEIDRFNARRSSHVRFAPYEATAE